MAINKVQDGKRLRLTVASGTKSGDPVVIGAHHGVALTDYNASDGKADIDTEGVFDLSVKGVDGSGSSAVAVGDKIYYVSGDTPKLSKKATGENYAIACGAVASGATATIPVKLI